MDFNITCEKGITYTNIETFKEDFDHNGDSFTDENEEEIDKYIWAVIEETDGKIPDTIWYFMREFSEDFLYNYRADRETLEYDIYKGYAYILLILQNPYTNNYFGIPYTDCRLSRFQCHYLDWHQNNNPHLKLKDYHRQIMHHHHQMQMLLELQSVMKTLPATML